MIFRYFKIADYNVSLSAEFDVAKYLPSFVPFVVDECEADISINISQCCEVPCKKVNVNSYDWYQGEATLYTTETGFLWERVDSIDGSCSSVWWNDPSPSEFTIKIDGRVVTHVLEHLLLIAFNYATLDKKTVILHSSVVVKDNEGYMFLGESGTGKSTHCRLWVNNIEGAEMLNDDAPVVRFIGDDVKVYGSPWSGKGACYRNVSVKIKGIYRLSQAPYNKLHKEGAVHALSALIPSCMPSLMEVDCHVDYVCDTLSEVISRTSCFHLECLPNPEAAMISYRGVITND